MNGQAQVMQLVQLLYIVPSCPAGGEDYVCVIRKKNCGNWTVFFHAQSTTTLHLNI